MTAATQCNRTENDNNKLNFQQTMQVILCAQTTSCCKLRAYEEEQLLTGQVSKTQPWWSFSVTAADRQEKQTWWKQGSKTTEFTVFRSSEVSRGTADTDDDEDRRLVALPSSDDCDGTDRHTAHLSFQWRFDDADDTGLIRPVEHTLRPLSTDLSWNLLTKCYQRLHTNMSIISTKTHTHRHIHSRLSDGLSVHKLGNQDVKSDEITQNDTKDHKCYDIGWKSK